MRCPLPRRRPSSRSLHVSTHLHGPPLEHIPINYTDQPAYFFDPPYERQTLPILSASCLQAAVGVDYSNASSFSMVPSRYLPTNDCSTDWMMADESVPYDIFDPHTLDSNDLLCRTNGILDGQQPQAYEQPYSETLEPQMMLQNHDSLPLVDNLPQMVSGTSSSNYEYESCALDQDTPSCFHAGYREQYLLSDRENSSDSTICTPVSKHTDEDEMDKPYARLIYEALMQAPGHRMMLREIYEWFRLNTAKPQESGTNGWQNSIRHNLSMNQAFENDKSDVRSTKGQPRKTNSMWILTDYAIRYGVQSTTRYRKTGMVKKNAASRTPAIQRQRSGARGGRAARRSAARLRKEQEENRTKEKMCLPRISPPPPPPPSQLQSPTTVFSDDTPFPVSSTAYQPATPADEHYPELLYGLSAPPYAFQHALVLKPDHSDYCGNDGPISDYLQPSTMDSDLDEVLKVNSE